ncbi:MAG: TldD/PmbA family protein [Halanaerobiaceae bacterium]
MLNKTLIEDILDTALTTGGDFAEVFNEDRNNSSIKMVGGNVEKAISGRDYGVGIRIFQGTNVVYAYTNEVNRDNLLKITREAAEALKGNSTTEVLALVKEKEKDSHPIKFYPHNIEQKEKVSVMKMAHQAADNYDSLIDQIVINYQDVGQNVLIANSEGLLTEDERVRTRMSINVVATKDGEKQTGHFAPGAHRGFEFYEDIDIEGKAREAAKTAVTMVKADFCPSGRMPVVINNNFGGVIFHEACGHSLEATSVAKGTSVFTGKMGQQIASKKVTAIDDGTIPHAWGSQNIDDEGIPTQKNVLIEDGILKNYMVDRLNARRMEAEPTGSGRRQSYKYAPTSRMTNTYIDNGESSREEIISNTEKGLFAKYMGGGSVDPATGEFNFNVREGYLIENGEITKPVRGATLIGKGEEILKKIDMVGNNLGFGQGMCGSLSGSIPTNVGQPMLRVSELTVGGRESNK